MNIIPGIIRTDRRDRLTGQLIHAYQHRSGLRIDVVPKCGFRNKYAGFLIPFGMDYTHFADAVSAEEIVLPLGTAHFMEHCLFGGSTGEQVNSALTAMGVEAEAFTTPTYTLYSLICVDDFSLAVEQAFKAVFYPEFSTERIAREREIIDAEYTMYREDLSTAALRVLLRNCYMTPNIYEDVLGNRQSIETIDVDHLKAMHRNFYRPENISLILVGTFDEEEVIRRLAALLDAMPFNEQHLPKKIPPPQFERVPTVAVQRLELPFNSSSFWIAYRRPGDPRGADAGANLVRRRLSGISVVSMLIGPGSEFFEALLNRGLVDESLAVDYVVEEDYAYLLISGDSLQPERAAERITQYIEAQVTKRELDTKRVREIMRSGIGEFLRLLDDVQECGEQVAAVRLRHMEFADYAAIFTNLSNNEMLDELQFLLPENRAVVVVHGNRKERKR